METAFINTPLGFAKLEGDEDGLTSVLILDTDEQPTRVIPEVLEDASYQLREYFEGYRKAFSLTLNPKGTDFQKRVWEELQHIPYGKTISYLELSKKLLPDMPSYSLGKLVRNLGIPITDRHRAQGDAKATVALFKILLAKDSFKEILSQTIKKETKKKLEPKLLDLIEGAPSETGVYYMYNDSKRLIYIGISRNIRKKLIQHFTNENRKSKRLQLETTSVSFEKTGNELIALIKENEEIVKNKPLYNRARRGKLFTHQIVSSVDENGYINLRIEKADGRKRSLMTFSNYQQAKSTLSKITEENELCMKLNGLQETSESCFGYTTQDCYGACVQKESTKGYNDRVKAALEKESLFDKSLLLIDRGRETEERSIIWIENGTIKGYGYYNLNYQITKPEILKNILNPIADSGNAKHIIQSYLRKNKIIKTVNLSSNTVS